ncbi:hypothetical protein ACOJIV_18185 [Haloarcula sp. AONF1]
MSYPIRLPPASTADKPVEVATASPAIGTAEYVTSLEEYPNSIRAFVQPKLLLYGRLARYGAIRSESAFRALRRVALAAIVRRNLPACPGMDLVATCTEVLDSLSGQRPTIRAFIQGLLHPVFREEGYLKASGAKSLSDSRGDSPAVLADRRSSLDALVERPEVVADVEALTSDLGRPSAERAVHAALDVGVRCHSADDLDGGLGTKIPSIGHMDLNFRARFDRAAATLRSSESLEDLADNRVAVRRLSHMITRSCGDASDIPVEIRPGEPIGAGVLGPDDSSLENPPIRSNSGPLLGKLFQQGFRTGKYGGLVYPLPETTKSDRSWLVNPWWAAESIPCPFDGTWDYEQLWERTWLFEQLVGQLLARSTDPARIAPLECPFCVLRHPCGREGCQFEAILGELNRQLHGCVQRLAAQLTD